MTVAGGVLYLRRSVRIGWAHDHTLPEIASLAAKGDYVTALRLAESAEKIIPRAPQLASLLGEISTRVTIETTPVGASVEMKEYTSPDDRWISLGKTPLQQVRVPLGYFRWRVSKPGFAATEAAFATAGGTRVVRFSLDPESAVRQASCGCRAASSSSTSRSWAGWAPTSSSLSTSTNSK